MLALCYFIISTLLSIFECHPVAFFWDKSIQGGSCINQKQSYRWNSVMNLLLDFGIWSLAFPMVWCMQLNRRQKLSVSAFLSLGMMYVAHFNTRGEAANVLDEQCLYRVYYPRGGF